jgi:hypothetical protein
MEATQPRYHLGKITNKFLILDIIFLSFFRKNGLSYLFQGCKIFRTLLKENYKAAKFMSKEALKDFEDRVSRSLLHRNDLPCTTSQVDLPLDRDYVYFVCLSEEKLFTAAAKTLYVYLLSDTTSPISTYSLSDECFSGMISDNRLYLGGQKYLEIFDLATSLT